MGEGTWQKLTAKMADYWALFYQFKSIFYSVPSCLFIHKFAIIAPCSLIYFLFKEDRMPTASQTLLHSEGIY